MDEIKLTRTQATSVKFLLQYVRENGGVRQENLSRRHRNFLDDMPNGGPSSNERLARIEESINSQLNATSDELFPEQKQSLLDKLIALAHESADRFIFTDRAFEFIRSRLYDTERLDILMNELDAPTPLMCFSCKKEFTQQGTLMVAGPEPGDILCVDCGFHNSTLKTTCSHNKRCKETNILSRAVIARLTGFVCGKHSEKGRKKPTPATVTLANEGATFGWRTATSSWVTSVSVAPTAVPRVNRVTFAQLAELQNDPLPTISEDQESSF